MRKCGDIEPIAALDLGLEVREGWRWGVVAASRIRRSEPVHVFAEWCDGPRSGLADYLGRPHLYESLWRAAGGRVRPAGSFAELERIRDASQPPQSGPSAGPEVPF